MHNRFHFSIVASVLATAVAGASCKMLKPVSDFEKEVAPHRAKATAHVESLKKLARAMGAAPRITSDAVVLDAGPVVIGGAESFDVTAGLVYEEDLGDVESPYTKEKWPAPKARMLGQCATMLKGGAKPAAHLVGRLAKNCADAKYAVVVRTLARKAPVVREADKQFDMGSVSGEAHVWNLESGKDLGGFRFSTQNDTRVKTRGISSQIDVERDLATNAESAIEAGLKKFAR